MNREIKFRAFFKRNGRDDGMWVYYGINGKPKPIGSAKLEIEDQQYTGFKDKHQNEIYEGDIFRVEEDLEDRIYYLVIVWVKEWGMFCTLRVDDEYFDYMNDGIKALDEPMFWTYTLEDTNDRRFFLCGNIHQNPELVGNIYEKHS